MTNPSKNPKLWKFDKIKSFVNLNQIQVNEPFEFNDEVGAIEIDTNMEWDASATFTVTGWGSKHVSYSKQFFHKLKNIN